MPINQRDEIFTRGELASDIIAVKSQFESMLFNYARQFNCDADVIDFLSNFKIGWLGSKIGNEVITVRNSAQLAQNGS